VSLSRELCVTSVDAIVERLSMTELAGDGTPERLVLTSPMSPDAPVGAMRRWRNDDGYDLAYVSLTVPAIGLDSHMLFAFSPVGSPVPHFTVDSVASPGSDGPTAGAEAYAFHLDLIPKVDLGAHVGYLRHCFEPLTALKEKAAEIHGLSPAHLSPTQYAVMSPWMVVHRADESAFREAFATIDAYREHWLALVAEGVPAGVLDGLGEAELAERDRRNRAIVFDPGVDPVWERVARLVGDHQAEAVRSSLAEPET
jgi:hypothetical protein